MREASAPGVPYHRVIAAGGALGGYGGNIARSVNHSCTPNCYTIVRGDTIWIVAARNIRKGEELTYDYSTDGPGHIRCRCRPGCETML